MAFERDGDCGIYNVATLERAGRRGPRGTGVAAVFPGEAVARDYGTVNLRATPMTERPYAPGLRDLGRILEYMAPPAGVKATQTSAEFALSRGSAHTHTNDAQSNK